MCIEYYYEPAVGGSGYRTEKKEFHPGYVQCKRLTLWGMFLEQPFPKVEPSQFIVLGQGNLQVNRRETKMF